LRSKWRKGRGCAISRLILHIGLHKTGTTSFQRFCLSHHGALARHGVIYPQFISNKHPKGVLGHHGLTLNLAPHFPETVLPEGAQAAWDDLVMRFAGADKTVIVSSEEFSRGRKGFRVDMTRLGQIAERFDRVQVVCVLRDQLSFLQSVFYENTRFGRDVTPEWLLGNALRKNDAAGLWVDWRPLYAHLRQGFEEDQLTFLDYETTRASAAGIIGTILGFAGVKARAGARENASPDPLAYGLCHRVCAPKPVPAWMLAAVTAELAQRFGPRPRCLFTRMQARSIARHFAIPNAELVAQIRKTQPAFHLTPPNMPADMLYRDDIGPQMDDFMAQFRDHA
jgi:hypothetical protein